MAEPSYRVQAFNSATHSENRMHDDAVAQKYGFSGGLVPGVDVFAYMVHVPVAKWGRAFLERGLIWVSSVTTIAPLLGFLGTVSGMINAFEAIAASEQVNAKLVASGISEALITTASGLIVAIPATIGYNYFISAIDRFVIEMEETSAELIEELERLKG